MALEVSITNHRLQGCWVTDCPFLWSALPKSIPIMPAKSYFLASWGPFFLPLLQAFVKLSQMATEVYSLIFKFTFLSSLNWNLRSTSSRKMIIVLSLFSVPGYYTKREFWYGFPSTTSQLGFVCRWSGEAIIPFLLRRDWVAALPIKASGYL